MDASRQRNLGALLGRDRRLALLALFITLPTTRSRWLFAFARIKLLAMNPIPVFLRRTLFLAFAVVVSPSEARSEAHKESEFTLEPGFESLFNGEDLTGWGYRVTPEAMRKQAANWQKNDPNAPSWPFVDEAEVFDGETESSDGRYVARDGYLVVTEPTEGRRIQQIYTTRDFEGDFTLRLQFRASPNADSGVFLKGPQLQCRDYLVAGPYKNLETYKPQEWNDLEVVARDGTARCTVNGEVIEEAFKVPEKGPIGLEGDRGQMEYRRLRINVE